MIGNSLARILMLRSNRAGTLPFSCRFASTGMLGFFKWPRSFFLVSCFMFFKRDKAFLWQGIFVNSETYCTSVQLCQGFIQCVTVLRIRVVYPGSEFFHPGSRIKGASDPGSAAKNLSIFNPNNCHQALGNMIRDVFCGSLTEDLDFSPKSTGSWIRSTGLWRLCDLFQCGKARQHRKMMGRSSLPRVPGSGSSPLIWAGTVHLRNNLNDFSIVKHLSYPFWLLDSIWFIPDSDSTLGVIN